MAALVLVRYGELALKSPPVRREFETSLRRNIVDQFVRDGLDLRLRSDRGHLYAEAEDADRAVRVLRRIFGITSVSSVTEVPTDRDGIRTALGTLADGRLTRGSSFAVRVRRTGNHPFTSQELARELGGEILARYSDRELTVDLEHPAVELFVEVRGPRTYLYFDRVAGPGGIPLGVAGSLAALVDGRRGALGAYLMMKRGCRVSLVAVGGGVPLAETVLRRFDPAARVAVGESDPGAWTAALGELADAVRAEGIVLPIDLEGYSAARELWKDRVVFSPTVGLTDEEVETRWSSVTALVG